MPAARFVDLFRLRSAVAALFVARHRYPQLDAVDLLRTYAAVDHLHAQRASYGGEIAVACRALLSPAADPGGRRRVAAIDRLAALTHVDNASAPALAALADDEIRVHPQQPSLFDHLEVGEVGDSEPSTTAGGRDRTPPTNQQGDRPCSTQSP